MSYALVLRFEGVTEEDYWSVNSKLGIDRNGQGDWPAGLLDHSGGPVPGGWVVIEHWASKDVHESFMASRLGAALADVGVPEPAQVIESETVLDRSLR